MTKGISTLYFRLSIETEARVSAFLACQGAYRLIGQCSRYARKFLWHRDYTISKDKFNHVRGEAIWIGNREFLGRY